MQSISETTNGSSWPTYGEIAIWKWVDSGDANNPKLFATPRGMNVLELFNTLKTLRQRCGGVLYDNEDKIIFASDTEWGTVLAKHRAKEEKARSLLLENELEAQQLEKRLSDIIAIGRADHAFWDALRSKEIAFESATQKAMVSDLNELFLILQGKQQGPEQSSPSVDELFVQFANRFCEPDRKPTLADIVLRLRREIRQDLGWDASVLVFSHPRA